MRLRIALAFFTALALMSTQLPAPARARDCMRANEDGAIAEGRLTERDDAIILKLPRGDVPGRAGGDRQRSGQRGNPRLLARR